MQQMHQTIINPNSIAQEATLLVVVILAYGGLVLV
jgi:hypothetical protein